jgi:membrane protein YdbS with pleckstrin-like domain
LEKEIAAIHGSQTAKVLAILTSLVFLLIFVPIALILFIAGWTTGGKEGSRFLFLGIVYLLMPMIYLPLMYIFIRLYCWLYNKMAARFGGIRFTLTDL